jgi:hypothetical protein
MEDDEPLYSLDSDSIPFTRDERAFTKLQHAVAKRRQAANKYEKVISKQPVTMHGSLKSKILEVKTKYIVKLRELLNNGQKLHDEAIAAENNIYKDHAAKIMKTASKQLHDLQSGGSRRRRIKSARKNQSVIKRLIVVNTKL